MKSLCVVLLAILIAQCQAFGESGTAQSNNDLDTRYQGINPAAFVNIGGKEYYFSPLPETLDDALRYCSDFGLRLISLESEDKNNLIKDYLQSILSSKTYWTSAFKVLDRWMWTGRGQFFSYLNWAPGEPNFPGPEAAGLAMAPTGAWFDYASSATFYYICESNSDC